MQTEHPPAIPTGVTGLAAERHGDRRVTFPVEGGIYGVGRLVKRLNALMREDSIAVWQLAGWTDWKHGAIRIDFASPEDASHAEDACRDEAPDLGREPVDSRRAAGRAAAAVTPPAVSVAEAAGAEPRDGRPEDEIGVWDDEGGARRARVRS
jgi:hypothetical protein